MAPNLTRRQFRVSHLLDSIPENTNTNKTRRANKIKKLMSMGNAQRRLAGFRWANTTGKPLTNTAFFNYRNKQGRLLSPSNTFTPINAVPIPKEPRQFIPAMKPNTRKSKYNAEISRLYAQISAMTNDYSKMMEIARKARAPSQVREKLMEKINRDFYNLNEPRGYSNYHPVYSHFYTR